MLVHRRGTVPQHFIRRYPFIHLDEEKYFVGVKCLAQECNAVPHVARPSNLGRSIDTEFSAMIIWPLGLVMFM